MKKALCMLSILFLLGLMAGCVNIRTESYPTAEEIRRQQEQAEMMRETQARIQRMRDQQSKSSGTAEKQP
jgi:F0F1-type ATP synthase assembly protein I